MTVYYIRHEDYDSRAKVIHGLVEIYQLGSYRLTAVDVPENLQGVIGPLLESLAEHVEKPLNVFNPDNELPRYPPVDTNSTWMVEPESGSTTTITGTDQLVAKFTPVADPIKVKKPRKQIPMELCPECGKMGVMTKKGYCKLCAMRKAKEAKNPPPSVPPSGGKGSAAPVVRENPPGAPEIVFETTPVEMRQLHRHGAIKGKRLG